MFWKGKKFSKVKERKFACNEKMPGTKVPGNFLSYRKSFGNIRIKDKKDGRNDGIFGK